MNQRNWLTQLIDKLFGFDQMAEEYLTRFILPKRRELIGRGLTPEQADELVWLALKHATPEYHAGARLYMVLDMLDVGWSVESVREYLATGKLRLLPDPPPADYPPGFTSVTKE